MPAEDVLSGFLSLHDVAMLTGDVTTLFADTNVTRSVTWYYIGDALEDNSNPSFGFSGSFPNDLAGASSSVRMIRGHVRDSVTGEIVTGRYRYLAKVSALLAIADTGDLILDSTDYLRVQAVRPDPISQVMVIEASKVKDG